MEYRDTIARNHLSDASTLAGKGRYGDTEIARTSKGEMWHVNPQEKASMSMYGMEGEKMVDAAGSGTINPETGLEEKFPIFAAISAATAVYSAWKGGSEKRTLAKAEQRAADQGLERLEGAQENLDKAVESKKQAAQQDFSTQIENVSAETGIRKEDLEAETETAIQRSGLATAGGVQQKASSMWNRIQGTYERGREGLTGQLGKAMGEIEGWYEGEKARLSSERQKFDNQKKLSKEQEGSWYLGKGIEQAGEAITGR
jgi:hypothetical protein